MPEEKHRLFFYVTPDNDRVLASIHVRGFFGRRHPFILAELLRRFRPGGCIHLMDLVEKFPKDKKVIQILQRALYGSSIVPGSVSDVSWNSQSGHSFHLTLK